MISYKSVNKKESTASNNKQSVDDRQCVYCGQQAQLVWVHGHGQCSACGINVDECCRGENCEFDQ